MVRAGIESFDLGSAMAEVKLRMIWHATTYQGFAHSGSITAGATRALDGPDFKMLDVISLRLGRQPWLKSFLDMLRPGWEIERIVEEFEQSNRFLMSLARKHPGRVRLWETEDLPSVPIIVLDRDIYFGHYAHSTMPAPQGFWVNVRFSGSAPGEETGLDPESMSRWNRAGYRLISDCLRAMRTGERVWPLACLEKQA